MGIAVSNIPSSYNGVLLFGNNEKGTKNATENKATDKVGQVGEVKCQTCSNRRYQDGSSDPGVSFKTPGKIDPKVSCSVVMSHEQEHVRNEAANAYRENREIVSQSVRLETSICPECGTSYVSGGTTTTVTKSDNKNERKDFFLTNYNNLVAQNFGLLLDVRV